MDSIVECELNKYPVFKKYFHSLIRKALQASIPERNVLIRLLSDLAPESKESLKQLEDVLELGDSNCTAFKEIFHNIGNHGVADLGKTNDFIHDVLTEVEAFEYLHSQNFTDIGYIPPNSVQSTPDFTAYRDGYQYAIEASRVNLPQSEHKQVKPFFRNRWIKGLGSDEAKEPFFNTLFPKYENKYLKQVEPFCRAGGYCGIVILSTGDRFFVSQWTRDEFTMLPRTTEDALIRVWQKLKKNNHCPYLHHIVFVVRRRGSTYTYPNFLERSAK